MNHRMAGLLTIIACLLAGGSIGAGPVVAPVVSWANFLGGALSDLPNTIAVDSSGNVIVAGRATSTDFPVTNGSTFGGGLYDAFVAKFSPDGSTLLWSTYLGGSQHDQIMDIAVDSDDNVVGVGATVSTNFPTTSGAFQTSHPGGTGWMGMIVRLDGSTGALQYGSYLTSATGGAMHGVATGPNGTVYATGRGTSGFPTTPGAFDRTNPPGLQSNAVVVVMDLAGGGATDVLYSTFIGGDRTSQGNAIAVDAAGDAYVCGFTLTWKGAFNFPITSNAFLATLNVKKNSLLNAMVFCKLRPGGAGAADLLYSTYLAPNPGGSDAKGICLTSGGLAVIAGHIQSADGLTATATAYDTGHNGSNDGFVCVFDATKSGAASRTYSTFIGGTGQDNLEDVALDAAGRILLAGVTFNATYPTTAGAVQTTLKGTSDMVFSVLDLTKSGSAQLAYSTRFGGNGSDWGYAIRGTSDGGWVGAGTLETSTNYPTGFSWPYDATPNGGVDVGVIRFAP